MPRRSQRLSKIHSQTENRQDISTSNRFEISPPKKTPEKPMRSKDKEPTPTLFKNTCKSDIVYNISGSTLTVAEQNVLEKGCNFCPSVKLPDKTRLLDDLYRFCRKLKLKEHFHNPTRSKSVPVDEESDEQCELNAKVSNRFYNPSQDPSKVLATYISAMKKDVSDMMNKPNYEKPHMTVEERAALKSLKDRKDVIIQSADKGGKVVVMNRGEYTEKCTADLSNNEFYQVMESDPTPRYIENIHQSIADLRSQETITENEAKFLSDPLVPTFYDLPKIHI